MNEYLAILLAGILTGGLLIGYIEIFEKDLHDNNAIHQLKIKVCEEQGYIYPQNTIKNYNVVVFGGWSIIGVRCVDVTKRKSHTLEIYDYEIEPFITKRGFF